MADPVTNGTPAESGDVKMEEAAAIQQTTDMTDPQPPPQPPTANAPTDHLSSFLPPPPATSTPPITSAPTTRPGSMPPQPFAKPDKPVAHGGPTRQYLNQNVTPHLLEAMKYLAVYEPDKPLQWLSEFLRDRSKEVEG